MDEDTQVVIAPVRANVWDFVCAFVTFNKGIAQAFVDAWEVVEITAIAASAERTERFMFQRDAVRGIEEIAKGKAE